MSSIKITEETGQSLSWNDLPEDSPYTVVEKGEWEDDNKYQYLTTIFMFEHKTYAASVGRSGSYFSDYNYEYDEDCPEVKPVETVVTRWVNV